MAIRCASGRMGIDTRRRARSCANIWCAADFSWPTIFTGLKSGKNSRSASNSYFPIAPIEDIPDDDPIFHTVYDMDDRVQRAGQGSSARGIEKRRDARRTGAPSMTINGRVMVAISYNSDLGDAWEWADDPVLSGRDVAFRRVRLGVNYVIYAMSH